MAAPFAKLPVLPVATTMHDCPEISDLIVDYDLTSLERRPVRKSAVLDTLAQHQNHWALRIARAFPATDGVLDPHFVDGALVRSHLELQRLHEEFLMGMRVLEVLEPLVTAVSARYPGRPVRVVDLGCGLGFVVRWLAKYGALPPHVALVGADYNASFTHAARVLAAEEALPCTFVTGNAFRLAEPATIVTSTGVLHHFRGSALTEVFSHQDRAGVLAFLHFDIKPSIFAPIGSWIFHRARMREPVARHDGYLSAVRAHDGASLLAAAREGAPGLRAALFDGHVGALRLVRIMHAIVGVRPDLEDGFVRALGVRRSRLSGFAGAS